SITIDSFPTGLSSDLLALEQTMMENQQLFVTAQKQTSVTTPKEEDVYQHGTIVHIKHVEKLANGTFRVFVKGETRAKVSRFLEDDPFFTVEVETLEDIHGELEEEEALKRFLFQQFSEYMKVSRKIGRAHV